MREEIIRLDGDLKREVWVFSLGLSYASPCIYFDAYSIETRESTRHRKWFQRYHWERLNRRGNNMHNPPLPKNVEDEMRSRYQEYIKALPIKG